LHLGCKGQPGWALSGWGPWRSAGAILLRIKLTKRVNFTYYDVVQSLPSLPASRAKLARVLRASKEIVSVDVTSAVLGINHRRAAEILSRWLRQGWLRRVGHGLYAPVPLDLAGSEQVVSDPWILVPALFGESYVGGWTAAHHWELTEQLFNETVVFTTRRVARMRVVSQGATFVLHHTVKKRLFGLKTLWRGSTKVSISDPARTLIDMLATPVVGGGIDNVADCLATYVRSKEANREVLIRYAEQYSNGVLFKRLGFLAEARLRDQALADACRMRLTQGYARLDPALPSAKLVTTWKLWIPAHWTAHRRDR
jgi:predicted transcriptional regulator of viral defense system